MSLLTPAITIGYLPASNEAILFSFHPGQVETINPETLGIVCASMARQYSGYCVRRFNLPQGMEEQIEASVVDSFVKAVAAGRLPSEGPIGP